MIPFGIKRPLPMILQQPQANPLQCHKQQRQQQRPQPFYIKKLHDKLAQPVCKAPWQADLLYEIVACPKKQLVLFLIRQSMGIGYVPEHEHADAYQHRQSPIPVSFHCFRHIRCKSTHFF